LELLPPCPISYLPSPISYLLSPARRSRGIGWEALTDPIFAGLCGLPGPRVFLLWGQQASGLPHHIHRPEHLVLQAPHPSPLSAYRGFFGSRPFGQTNAWLSQHGLPPIHWHLDPLGSIR
jgi:uracil-DNA glycosylase